MENLFPVLRKGGTSNGSGSRIIWSKEQITYVVEHYSQHHNVKQLAQICGVSQDAMRRLLKKQKITIKSTQEKWKEIYPKNSMYFNKIDSCDKAYWLGFLYADGCNNTKTHNIRINLQKTDEKHLQKFLSAIGATNTKIKYQKKKVGEKEFDIAYISFVDKQMSEDLAKQGCIPKKSLKLVFPTEEIVPSKYIYHFIRGYFDGDGSIYYSHKKNTSLLYFHLNILGTKDFLEEIKKIFKKEHLALECKNTHYVLHFCGNKQVFGIMNKLYENSNENIELTRKKDKFNILLLQRIGGEPRNLGCA